jgi:hypothetical protein
LGLRGRAEGRDACEERRRKKFFHGAS